MGARRLCHGEHSTDVIVPRVWCINWHFNGRILATCGDDKTVKIWEFTEENGLKILSQISGDHSRTIRYVEFSKSGQYLACASFDSTITIYEHRNNEFEEVHKLEGHENEIKCCGFSASDEFLASCSRDKTVWVWQVEDDEYEVGSILQTHSADVKFVAWHPFEDIFVSGGYDCSIRFYKFDGENWVTLQAIPDAHDDTVWSGAFDLSGEYFVSCGADCFIKIWKKNSAQESDEKKWTKVLECAVDTRWPLYSASWNPSNELIAVAGGDQNLRIFRFDAENSALTFFSKMRLDSEINCVRWNPKNSNVLAAACDSGLVHLIEVNE